MRYIVEIERGIVVNARSERKALTPATQPLQSSTEIGPDTAGLVAGEAACIQRVLKPGG